LNRQRDAACRPELVTGVLLICRQPGAKLIASGRASFRRPISRSNY
jgi:hypothetical protein